MKLPFITTKRAASEQKVAIKEALGVASGGIDNDAYKYRSLTQSKTDLPAYTQDRMIEICYHLYVANPLAHRIIEMTKDYIIGEGITYESNDPDIKKVLDTFWKDPINNWGERQHQFFAELGIYGELALPVAVNTVDGRVQMGYINPADIKRIKTNSDNCLILEKLVVKDKTGTSEGKSLDIVNPSPDGKLVGDCFFFKVNSVSDMTRGVSDLYSIADWLDSYDKFLFNRLDRSELINNFIWDVTIDGADLKEVEEFKRTNSTKPKPGSIRFHNAKVDWKAVAPMLQAADAAEDAKLIKNHILAAAGFPDYFFASAENGTIVSEMNEPTLKKISARQLYVKHIIENIFNFVLDQAEIYGTLAKGTAKDFAIIMPDISQKDNNRNARAVGHLCKATKDITDSMEVVSAQTAFLTEEVKLDIVTNYRSNVLNISKSMNLILSRLGINPEEGSTNATGKEVKL